jgi:hypothetical protein
MSVMTEEEKDLRAETDVFPRGSYLRCTVVYQFAKGVVYSPHVD